VLVVIAAACFAGAKFLTAQEVFSAMRRFDWGFAAPILGASSLYLVFSVLRFATLLRPVTGMPLWALARGYLGAQPASAIPGGVAFRAAIFRRVGIPAASTSVPILLSSALDQLVMVLITVVAALWFRQARHAALTSISLLGVAAVLLLVPFTRRAIGRAVGALLHRIGWWQHWEQFTESLSTISTPSTLLPAFIWTVAAYAAAALEFWLCLSGIGVKLPFWSALLSYTLPSVAGRVLLTPGGIGVTDGGMIGLLHALGGITVNTAAAGAALFRVSDSLYQWLVGLICYVAFWRGNQEDKWLNRAGAAKPTHMAREVAR
jgi:uncharacterized protein (TIRG00374 family)